MEILLIAELLFNPEISLNIPFRFQRTGVTLEILHARTYFFKLQLELLNHVDRFHHFACCKVRVEKLKGKRIECVPGIVTVDAEFVRGASCNIQHYCYVNNNHMIRHGFSPRLYLSFGTLLLNVNIINHKDNNVIIREYYQ